MSIDAQQHTGTSKRKGGKCLVLVVRLVTISKRWGRGSGTSNNCLEQNKSKEGGKGGGAATAQSRCIFLCRILWKLPSRFSSSDYWKCPISKTFNIQIKFSMTRLPQQYLIAQFIVQCNRIINFQSWSTFHVLPFSIIITALQGILSCVLINQKDRRAVTCYYYQPVKLIIV